MWQLDAGLAGMLVALDGWAEQAFTVGAIRWPGIYILSGQRSEAENRSVGGVAGSLHLRCPSLAADIRMGNLAGLASPEVMAILGGRWRLMGGRWGGTFTDPSPNHFDLGVGTTA